MKRITLLLIVFSSLTSYAAKYYDATVTFIDGKSKTGLVESPFGGDYIFFKQNEGATVEELDATTVKGMKFTIDGTWAFSEEETMITIVALRPTGSTEETEPYTIGPGTITTLTNDRLVITTVEGSVEFRKE